MQVTNAIAIRGAIVVGTAVATYIVVRLASTLMRRARQGVPGFASIGWVFLFLTSGRMPPPPPASQIEAQLNAAKDQSQGHDMP